MPERLALHLFCEDAGHEAFTRAIVRRLALEDGLPMPQINSRSARGGHGRAISELMAWQKFLRSDQSGAGAPLLVVIDANGAGWNTMRSEVRAAVDPTLFPAFAVGCPDPHVEAWLAADPAALHDLLRVTLPPRPKTKGRASFKRWLREALEAAGEVILNDPMDISDELVPRMDLHAARRADPSLKAWVEELRAVLALGRP